MASAANSDHGYDSDEPPQLELDLDQLLTVATRRFGSRCCRAVRLTRGTSHEIFLLSFEEEDKTTTQQCPGSSVNCCIARFTREKSSAAVTRYASEVATLRYLKKNTDIPVPEVYYHDLNPNNAVGAPFILMERMKGCHLYEIWDDLSLDHKKAVLSQVASILVKFSSLHFNSIGCLEENGAIGPIISPALNRPSGPFTSVEGYLSSFVSTDGLKSPALTSLFQQIQNQVKIYLVRNQDYACLQPPYALIHPDLDGQNLLFIHQSDGCPPKLSGVIDFEYSYAGPRYFLYEYPIFIQDVSWSKELYPINAILRPFFIQEIYKRLPDIESQRDLISCMNKKSFVLNSFQNSFMSLQLSEDNLVSLTQSYLEGIRNDTKLAYAGRLDYSPELYLDDGELAPAVAK